MKLFLRFALIAVVLAMVFALSGRTQSECDLQDYVTKLTESNRRLLQLLSERETAIAELRADLKLDHFKAEYEERIRKAEAKAELAEAERDVLLQNNKPGVAKKNAVPLESVTKDQKSFVIKFPLHDENWETAWKIEWDVEHIFAARKAGMTFPKEREDNSPVLFKIKKAFFKPGKTAPWVQVLEDAHPSELYVPYYFRDTRFFDLRDAGEYVQLDPKEGGPRGMTLGEQRYVMAEARDRGLAYKNEGVSRRAEELALWANFNAGNYTYLIEFGFQDDGTIAFRHAPTGYNLPSDHFASHMHNCCWRIGVKLALENDKNPKNLVGVSRWPGNTPFERNPKLEAKTHDMEQLKTEGFLDWEAKEFTKIRVINPSVVLNEPKGENGRSISYDLVPLVQGIARHGRADENFTKHDFWITRHDSPVTQYVELGNYFDKKQPKALNDAPVVLWHMSSALHVPRSEDGILKGSALANGQAIATWTTVELRPRHLFTGTPIYRNGK